MPVDGELTKPELPDGSVVVDDVVVWARAGTTTSVDATRKAPILGRLMRVAP